MEKEKEKPYAPQTYPTALSDLGLVLLTRYAPFPTSKERHPCTNALFKEILATYFVLIQAFGSRFLDQRRCTAAIGRSSTTIIYIN